MRAGAKNFKLSELKKIVSLCHEHDVKAYLAMNTIVFENELNLEIANDNSPIQVVISGKKDEIKKSAELFLDNKIKRFVELNVSAAFHSKFMIEAQEDLSEEIEKLNFIEKIGRAHV